MMLRLVAVGFLLLYLVSMLKPVLPYVEYTINYEYISEVLCENKELPELECNGKCHLAKQFENAGKKEQKKPFSALLKMDNYPVTPITEEAVIAVRFTHIAPRSVCKLNARLSLDDIFHPPPAVV